MTGNRYIIFPRRLVMLICLVTCEYFLEVRTMQYIQWRFCIHILYKTLMLLVLFCLFFYCFSRTRWERWISLTTCPRAMGHLSLILLEATEATCSCNLLYEAGYEMKHPMNCFDDVFIYWLANHLPWWWIYSWIG